jgi:glucosylglycerate synthase
VEVEPIPEQVQVQEKIEQVDSADLVVGVLAELDQVGLAAVCDALGTLPGSPRVVVLRDDRAANPGQSNVGAATPGASSCHLIPWSLLGSATPGMPVAGTSAAYQSVFAASEKFGARACCVIASSLETATPGWVREMAQPLVERNLDLVVPHYARRKFAGLLNSSIISPLMRCLYGKRINNPMGPDLGLSRRLFQKMLGPERGAGVGGSPVHSLASVAPAALCENLQVCEVHLPARSYPPTDWMNISSLLAQILSPIFLDMERNAACWQRMRTSVSVSTIGEPLLVSQDTGTVDISRMMESFQLGVRDLQEIWGLVLPPSTLFELRKLARLPSEQFRMPDELWVRIVYDFALAHRLRTISRDHLLKSMTPLYLAWVSSYAHDVETAGRTALEERLERLSVAYEAGKTYLVSRWRWPDRFNP